MIVDIRIKRAYEAAESSDGYRVLVDRLWPRGVSKERAELDLWDKDVAPSTELRKAWHSASDGHASEGFAAFGEAYRAELAQPPKAQALARLRDLANEHPRLTLVYGAKDEQTNHAVVLREALLQL